MPKWWKRVPRFRASGDLGWFLCALVSGVVALWLLTFLVLLMIIDWIRGYLWRS
jgi:hypothetical protein